ncbi:MAG: hypothetical protein WDM79_13750 [Terricaulis sp.]
MTKLELAIERIRNLPPEQQEYVLANIEVLLDDPTHGESLFTDEEWADILPTLDEDREEIPHEQIVAEFQTKSPG